MEFSVGIHPGISRVDYDSVIALNQSTIKLIDERHMKAAWTRLHHPDPPSLAMIEGQAFHKLLLEPGRFDEDFIARPKWDMRTKTGQAARVAWEEQHPGWETKQEIQIERLIELQNQVAVLMEHPIVARWVDGLLFTEFAAFWNHPEYGFPCKALVDAVSRDRGRTWVWDAKSTRNATVEFWRKEVVNRGYLIQAEWTIQGLNAIAEAERDFAFVAVETAGYMDVAVFECGPLTRFEAKHRIAKACKKWARALETGRFEGAVGDVQMIEAPRWAMTHEQDFDQISEEGFDDGDE